jgi:hypothetical protein
MKYTKILLCFMLVGGAIVLITYKGAIVLDFFALLTAIAAGYTIAKTKFI